MGRRPKIAGFDAASAALMLAEGRSQEAIAAAMGLSRRKLRSLMTEAGISQARRGRREIPIDGDAVLEAARNGETRKSMAARLGVSREALDRRCALMGLAPPGKGWRLGSGKDVLPPDGPDAGPIPREHPDSK